MDRINELQHNVIIGHPGCEVIDHSGDSLTIRLKSDGKNYSVLKYWFYPGAEVDSKNYLITCNPAIERGGKTCLEWAEEYACKNNTVIGFDASRDCLTITYDEKDCIRTEYIF